MLGLSKQNLFHMFFENCNNRLLSWALINVKNEPLQFVYLTQGLQFPKKNYI